MREPTRQSGWDAQAIRDIAESRYGDFAQMFEAHGWPERGAQMMPAQGKRIAGLYGSVANFERAHLDGATSPFVDPLTVIQSANPDVWLTSFYGFSPRNWGFLGFSEDRMRTYFLRRSRPGALVVVYAASKGAPDERGQIIGIQQMGARLGEACDFMPEEAWREKQANPDRRDKWNYAVQAVRGWRVTPETRMSVERFAPESYWPKRSQFIGAWGVKLTPEEARHILHLDLVEVEVFGGHSAFDGLPGPAREVLKPSRPGPVSQTAFWAREAEGPKHLYILRLDGDADKLLGYSANGKTIVKVGFSHSPATRCEAHNKALPACAFKWHVERSTFVEDRAPYPSSDHALAGERVMKNLLEVEQTSLGGEFFLADEEAIARAWAAAKSAAENWTS
jgi:hypothetical protein